MYQPKWRRCTKCQAVWFSGGIDHPQPGFPTSICPTGGEHVFNEGEEYEINTLSYDVSSDTTQGDWAFCWKCKGIYFTGSHSHVLNMGGVCPAGGPHSERTEDMQISGNYSILHRHGNAFPGGEQGFRWCHKCEQLWYNGDDFKGVCPKGGEHSASGSGFYNLGHP